MLPGDAMCLFVLRLQVSVDRLLVLKVVCERGVDLPWRE